MKIFSAAQLSEADRVTIKNEGITSLELMERAAFNLTRTLMQLVPEEAPILVLAGAGNNGGDGLAVARMLDEAGRTVRVCRLVSERYSADNEANARLLDELDIPFETTEEPATPSRETWVVDALMGTGLNRPLSGRLLHWVKTVNAWRVPVVSIDLPSGLMTEDNSSNPEDGVIRANHTLTLETVKLAMFLDDGGPFCGSIHRVPLGLDPEYLNATDTPYLMVNRASIREQLPVRPAFAHKGTFGHAVIAAGSRHKPGAAVLAVQAALRSGCGLVTAAVPESVYPAMTNHAPEAMLQPECGTEDLERVEWPPRTTAVGIGPGLGTGSGPEQAVKGLLQRCSFPLVLDADALNLLAANPSWLPFLPPHTVLTPHPGELERLTGEKGRGLRRLLAALDFSAKWNCLVLLKGRYSALCTPGGKVFFNTTGNAALARGGTGDVLTGLITGLLAQGLDPLTACLVANYVHGLAAESLAEKFGQRGLTAGDLIRELPLAWKGLEG